MKGGEKMATVFANILSALSKVITNSVSTFTIFGYWDESECPEEML